MGFSRALEIMGDLYGPEFILQRHFGEVYTKHPVGARIAAVPAAAVSGFIKPLIAPLLAALGLVLFPILAAVKMEQGDVEGTKGYLIATSLCFLTLVGSLAFVAVTAYSLPLLWSSAVLITVIAVSIIIHVRQATHSPLIKI